MNPFELNHQSRAMQSSCSSPVCPNSNKGRLLIDNGHVLCNLSGNLSDWTSVYLLVERLLICAQLRWNIKPDLRCPRLKPSLLTLVNLWMILTLFWTPVDIFSNLSNAYCSGPRSFIAKLGHIYVILIQTTQQIFVFRRVMKFQETVPRRSLAEARNKQVGTDTWCVILDVTGSANTTTPILRDFGACPASGQHVRSRAGYTMSATEKLNCPT